ncbi:mechanosensitive ion channel domain-containing protein [Rhodoplanes sp. Z2-YC6860]|uniref:mechanosensitive ion channel domain-containing protein n=1 Tax=Rhodoplanes sp. Z2-YC6860 TaxID=674703 RepID=UPI00078D1FFD|nr:mechanosensitive ion channel domain-containing protein [Rhodoplanes sp. Z2-YC6860]AMN44863.1 mechanosensitive ion channel MscS [Rhodoplanes sp. Z2-YC6860]
MQKITTLALIIFALLTVQPAWSQDVGDAAAHPAPSVTAAQAQQALEVLQDDAKRGQLIQTLQTIAKMSSAQTASATAPAVAADNLGVQIMVQVSNWFGEVSNTLANAARRVTDFPMIFYWSVELAKDPYTRHILIDTAWKLALVLVCALAIEWLVWRALRRPLGAINRYVPLRSRQAEPAPEPADGTPENLGHELKRHSTLATAWQLTLRLPFVLARLVLDLAPVLAFAAVGNLLLATEIGTAATPRVIILAMVNAYVLCRVVLCVVGALVSPAANQPSLFIIRDETAAYITIWARRIVVLAVFGVALANVALLLGLYRPAYFAVVRIIILVVHLLLVVVTLQCRQAVADLIKAPDNAHGVFAIMRNRLADTWHILAIMLNLALWGVWALRVQNGYALLLQYFLSTVAVLVIARLAMVAVMAILDRIFRISPDLIRRYPGLEARANRYFPALRSTVSGIITAITIVALLEVWGIGVTTWFSSSMVGRRLLSAVATIGIASIVALAVWEAANAGMERHLARLARENRFGRAARLRTFLPMLRTTLLAVILTVVALTALSELGVNIAPLLAGAGIIGIAIGFGSQKLVQDLITGLFLLLENAMQVGDSVTVSGLSGVVENLSIRTIRLRAGDGSVHIVPFSSVTSVTNTNRGIGNAAISVSVDYNEDVDHVGEVLKEIVAEMRKEPRFNSMIRGDLDLWGVDKVDATMVTIAGQIQCTDSGRWPVQREFYRRMKKRFQETGIEIARPPSTTVVLQGFQDMPEKKPVGRARAG